MESLDFSEEEIEQQLAALGYTNITKQRLHEFKRDLDLLISHEKSKSQTSAEWSSPTSHSAAGRSPPVITKEKVQVHRDVSNYSYIYPHSGEADHERLSLVFQEDVGGNRPYDSYIKHSMAPRYIRPSTAPNRLEVEEAPSEDYHLMQDNQILNPDQDLHMNVKPSVKRKVLRKHQGQSHVCDESTFSEDSDHNRMACTGLATVWHPNAPEQICGISANLLTSTPPPSWPSAESTWRNYSRFPCGFNCRTNHS